MTDSNSCLKRIRGYKSYVQTSGCVLGAEAGSLSTAKILGHHFNCTLYFKKLRRESWSPDLFIYPPQHSVKKKLVQERSKDPLN